MKRLTVAGLLVLACAGCASSDVDLAILASNSDQVIWEAGHKAFEKKQWENARQHFRRIIDAFPQSQYAPEARVALGDAYFNEGGDANYILAVSAYRDFVTLYPSHPKADYAQFQTAESYFRRRHGADRDQTPTIEALAEFDRLLEAYPNSQWVEPAKLRIRDCRQSLARAEYLAGYFYQRTRRACRSAIPRYEGLVADYPDFDGIDEVLFRLGECLLAQGRAAEAVPHLQRLIDSYPGSGWLERAQQLIKSAEESNQVPPKAEPSSPPPSQP
ncbi:MAG TPA: outer membrane protein assembly factor BamD [Vicinamibacteria bacterium]|nr:outer membrane protein assembly factor BamD [Vicinamibacteria bacterium]